MARNFKHLYTLDEINYVNKLRLNYPNLDIPTDNEILNFLESYKRKNDCLKDLIIREYGGTLEFETV